MEALMTTVDDIFTRELAKVNASDLIEIKQTGRQLFDGKDVKTVVAKLAYASAIGATIKEACAFAGISRDSYYRCVNKHTEFRNKLEQLSYIPVLQARINIFKSLMAGDLKMSMWYLERKRRDEFGR